MTRVHHRQCSSCSSKYELLEHRRWNGEDYDAPTLSSLAPGAPENWLSCPECGSDVWHEVIGTPGLIRSTVDDRLPFTHRAPDVSERSLSASHFPYYDAGLGVMLHSPEHREWMKTHYKDGTRREPGEELVCVEDALPFDPAAIIDRQIAHATETERRYNAYKDEMLAAPDTRKAWHMVEQMVAARDLAPLGVTDPEFFGPSHYPPQGEAIKQDLDGHLFTDSGWTSDHPQPWVPLALEAAGHPPMLGTAPAPLALEGT